MEIYIIRHGETTANEQGRLQGQMEFDLTSEGVALAKQTGKSLCNVKFDMCFSSPLTRAVDTAKYVIAENKYGCPICTDDRLAEINMGSQQGQLIAGNDFAKQFFINPINIDITDGESIDSVMKRTQSFLHYVASLNYNRVLVSTHGCAIRCMLNFLYSNPSDFWQGHVPSNCCINILSYSDGCFSITQKD